MAEDGAAVIRRKWVSCTEEDWYGVLQAIHHELCALSKLGF